MAMRKANGRLSPEQLEQVQTRAAAFQEALVLKARGKVAGGSAEVGMFLTALFRLAGEAIEGDVEGFCDRAALFTTSNSSALPS